MKLNQLLAIEGRVKARGKQEQDELYKGLQRSPQQTGIARSYTPLNADDTVVFPSESTLVQFKVEEQLQETAKAVAEMLDLMAQKDFTNLEATANLVVDGNTLLENVPVTHLMPLEKLLTDWQTIIRKIPVLDPAEEWTYDAEKGVYRTQPTPSFRLETRFFNHVKWAPTPEHKQDPQVDVYKREVPVGTWTTVKFSGAIGADRKKALEDRIGVLLDAVRKAREEANSIEVKSVSYAEDLFGWLLAP